MRPYIAIIIDSFRAAFASRVLYVLLGLITVLLVALAPLHYREVMDWQLKRPGSVRDTDKIIQTLVANESDSARPELSRIWQLLPEELRVRMTEHANEESSSEENIAELDLESEGGPPNKRRRVLRNLYDGVVAGLNSVIEDRDFYRADDWEGIRLNQEAASFVEPGVETLNDEQSRRLNRLLMSQAFGGAIQNGLPTSLNFYYAWLPIPRVTFNIPRQQFAQLLTTNIPWFFDKFVMSFGLFIAIMVTANIIPETFDPGSLNLLLSKPISRSGLLISKFIGGCAFTAICATYLMVGAWLWLGWGLGVWDRSILYSIPLYILVFAIYYAVSTLVGLWYRSPILSVVLTVLFWGICFTIGTLFFWVNNRMSNYRMTTLVPVGAEVLAVDAIKTVSRWDDSANIWDTKTGIFDPKSVGPEQIAIEFAMYVDPNIDLPMQLVPMLDSNHDLIFSGQISLASAHDKICTVADSKELQFEQCGGYPAGTEAVMSGSSGPVVVTRDGKFYGFSKDLSKQIGALESAEKMAAIVKWSQEKPLFEPFDLVSGISLGRKGGNRIDLNQSNGEIAIYRRGTVTIFQPDDELGFQKHLSVEVDIQVEPSMSCHLTYQGSFVALILGNGEIILLDGKTLKEVRGYKPETRSRVEQVKASSDGKWFAAVYSNGHLWLLDTEDLDSVFQPPVGGQGYISGVAFDLENQIWVADQIDRATLYDPTGWQVVRRMTPSESWFAFAYRKVLRPLYLIFPKPGETYKLVAHLSDSGDTKNNRNVDLADSPDQKNPWSALWSGLGFMATLLLLSCVIFNYTDY